MSVIEKNGRSAKIAPDKDIVAGEVQNFKSEILGLISEKSDQILIDMSNVEMIDSTGIGVFICAQNSLKKINGALKVENVSPDILKMFKIMRLDKHFEVTGKN
jgi:anti-sigma B factor antagonist